MLLVKVQCSYKTICIGRQMAFSFVAHTGVLIGGCGLSPWEILIISSLLYLDMYRELVIGNIEGFADDYSCMICALIDLYEASHTPRWLEWAIQLQKKQDELFWDKISGGYFNSSGTDKSILLQMKEGNRVMENMRYNGGILYN